MTDSWLVPATCAADWKCITR